MKCPNLGICDCAFLSYGASTVLLISSWGVNLCLYGNHAFCLILGHLPQLRCPAVITKPLPDSSLPLCLIYREGVVRVSLLGSAPPPSGFHVRFL